jgi:hypothetical protein
VLRVASSSAVQLFRGYYHLSCDIYAYRSAVLGCCKEVHVTYFHSNQLFKRGCYVSYNMFAFRSAVQGMLLCLCNIFAYRSVGYVCFNVIR